jgi:predicted PurR-regulated permease PerM
MVAVSMVGNLPERRPSEPPLGGDKMRLVAIAFFGIAVLGLFTIFNSTSVPISLAACIMYIAGTVLGVLLLQTES